MGVNAKPAYLCVLNKRTNTEVSALLRYDEQTLRSMPSSYIMTEAMDIMLGRRSAPTRASNSSGTELYTESHNWPIGDTELIKEIQSHYEKIIESNNQQIINSLFEEVVEKLLSAIIMVSIKEDHSGSLNPLIVEPSSRMLCDVLDSMTTMVMSDFNNYLKTCTRFDPNIAAHISENTSMGTTIFHTYNEFLVPALMCRTNTDNMVDEYRYVLTVDFISANMHTKIKELFNGTGLQYISMPLKEDPLMNMFYYSSNFYFSTKEDLVLAILLTSGFHDTNDIRPHIISFDSIHIRKAFIAMSDMDSLASCAGRVVESMKNLSIAAEYSLPSQEVLFRVSQG